MLGPKAKRRTAPWGISSVLQGWMRRALAPALLRPAVQAAVLAVFVGLFALSLASLPRLSKCAPLWTTHLLQSPPSAIPLHIAATLLWLVPSGFQTRVCLTGNLADGHWLFCCSHQEMLTVAYQAVILGLWPEGAHGGSAVKADTPCTCVKPHTGFKSVSRVHCQG